MVRLAPAALLSAVLSGVNAASWINFPADFQVGKEVLLQWQLDSGEVPSRVVMQHESAFGEAYTVYQYETIVEWTQGTGAGVVSIPWVPNTAGPAFHLELWTDHVYGSPQFLILAADGTHVTTANPSVDRVSNLTPQTATGVWFPNAPPGYSASAAPTTSAAVTAETSATFASNIIIVTVLATPELVTVTQTSTAPPTSAAVEPSGTIGPDSVVPANTLAVSTKASNSSVITPTVSEPARATANVASNVPITGAAAWLVAVAAAFML